MSLDMIQYVGRKPSLEADIPLEPTGELDMRRVRELWGLETCAVRLSQSLTELFHLSLMDAACRSSTLESFPTNL